MSQVRSGILPGSGCGGCPSDPGVRLGVDTDTHTATCSIELVFEKCNQRRRTSRARKPWCQLLRRVRVGRGRSTAHTGQGLFRIRPGAESLALAIPYLVTI